MWPQWIEEYPELGDENNAGEPVVDTTMPATAVALEPLDLPIVTRKPGMPTRRGVRNFGFRNWGGQGRLSQVNAPRVNQVGAGAAVDPTAVTAETPTGAALTPAKPAAATPDNSIVLLGIKFTPLMLAAAGGGILLLLYLFGQYSKKGR